MREAEVFELRCEHCRSIVEIACALVQANVAACPHCGLLLSIEWEAERMESARR